MKRLCQLVSPRCANTFEDSANQKDQLYALSCKVDAASAQVRLWWLEWVGFTFVYLLAMCLDRGGDYHQSSVPAAMMSSPILDRYTYTWSSASKIHTLTLRKALLPLQKLPLRCICLLFATHLYKRSFFLPSRAML